MFATAAFASTAAAQEDQVVEYVAGTASPGQPGVPTGLALCQDIQGPEGPALGNPGVGGACGLAVDGKTSVTIADDNQDGVGFSYLASNANGDICADGTSSEDTATLDLPDECVELTIFTGLGATTGTITVSDLSES